MILQTRNLSKQFKLKAGLFSSGKTKVHAVENVNLAIAKGTSFGIVGESGSGKSTLARLLAGAYKIDGGEIEFFIKGKSSKFTIDSNFKTYKKEIADSVKYIFQDPASSLNPRMTIEEILFSGYKYSRLWKDKDAAYEKAKEIFKLIGLADNIFDKRPADFSGGQRQRISIARALMFEPEILICDEIVSALDLSIQSQILNLIADLKKELGLTIIFISHDLNVVSYICDTIAVMHSGVILEQGSALELSTSPRHPYTQFLYSSMPGKTQVFEEKSNQNVNQLQKLESCPYVLRCPYAMEICHKQLPELKEVEKGHQIACFVIA